MDPSDVMEKMIVLTDLMKSIALVGKKASIPLREKGPNTEIFLVRIFPDSD